MPQYVCKLCGNIFNTKAKFNEHNNKNLCENALKKVQNQVQENAQLSTITITIINKYYEIFINCLSILKENENLTEETALINMLYLYTLKLIEPLIGSEINFDNCEYDLSEISKVQDKEIIENYKNTLLKSTRFSNLSVEQSDDAHLHIDNMIDYILSVHPVTRGIFIEYVNSDIKCTKSYIQLLREINKIEMPITNYISLSTAFESIINETLKEKAQLYMFTNIQVRNFMIDLINPQIHKNGKIETCCDPMMGSGEFLITYLQYIMQNAINKNIDLDWNFIKSYGLYGKESDQNIYRIALANMLISSGHTFERFELGDSIKEPIIRKFDNIVSRIKDLDYNNVQDLENVPYIPFKTNNSISLYIQTIIHILKIEGKCTIILPIEQNINNKHNKLYIAIRKYLMETCDLREIIYIPDDVIYNVSVKMCILYFIKKKEGFDVINSHDQVMNALVNGEVNIQSDNQFSTQNIKFYNYHVLNNNKTLIIEVPINKIANNSYSLDYNEYLCNNNKSHDTYDTHNKNIITFKTIGDICDFSPKYKRNIHYGNDKGKYPFYSNTLIVDTFVDEPDYNEFSLIINTGTKIIINYDNKFSCSDNNIVLHIKEEYKYIYNMQYIYYYLIHNSEIIQKYLNAINANHITKSNICNLKIPFPLIEYQVAVISKCIHDNNIIKQLKKDIIICKKQTKTFITEMLNT